MVDDFAWALNADHVANVLACWIGLGEFDGPTQRGTRARYTRNSRQIYDVANSFGFFILEAPLQRLDALQCSKFFSGPVLLLISRLEIVL